LFALLKSSHKFSEKSLKTLKNCFETDDWKVETDVFKETHATLSDKIKDGMAKLEK
jgi:hypothetical protein